MKGPIRCVLIGEITAVGTEGLLGDSPEVFFTFYGQDQRVRITGWEPTRIKEMTDLVDEIVLLGGFAMLDDAGQVLEFSIEPGTLHRDGRRRPLACSTRIRLEFPAPGSPGQDRGLMTWDEYNKS